MDKIKLIGYGFLTVFLVNVNLLTKNGFLKVLNFLGFFSQEQLRAAIKEALSQEREHLINVIVQEANQENQEKISQYLLLMFGTSQKINLEELIRRLVL